MTNDYIHGYSPEEMRRLSRMQDILNDEELSTLDLRGVTRLLDVGAGLGQMTRAMARALHPGAKVLGIERDQRQLAAARTLADQAGESDLVELREGDATALPLTDEERGTFDLAHARFLLEHVPDPAAVVREMVAAVKPGGRIVLVDDDHDLLRIWPDCPEVEDLWRVYFESYKKRGFDPFIGRRLPQLLTDAGARVTRITSVFYGATRGLPLFDLVVDNLIDVLRGAPDLDAEAGIAAFQQWREQDAATVWYTLPLAEAIKPE